jgi:Ca2+-binding RTX toxin-like protein
LFDKVTIRNAQFTTDAFVLSAASFQTVDETEFGNDTIDGKGGADNLYGGFGNDTFNISNARDAFGDTIYGGFGTDTVKNVTTADTVVLTDFRTTTALGTQTVFGVEQFDGNGKWEIRGRDTAFDGVGNDTDALDFTGITFSGVTTINLRSGDDQYIGGNTGLTVNGGSGNDTMSAGVGGGTLKGEAGTDTLTGGTTATATTLNGGARADILTAGTGATTFDFLIADINSTLINPTLNQDSVFGFTSVTDKIQLNTSVYGQGALDVVIGTGPSGTGGLSEIRYQTIDDDTTIYLPGTGSNAFRSILLDGFSGSLSTSDFIQV